MTCPSEALPVGARHEEVPMQRCCGPGTWLKPGQTPKNTPKLAAVAPAWLPSVRLGNHDPLANDDSLPRLGDIGHFASAPCDVAQKSVDADALIAPHTPLRLRPRSSMQFPTCRATRSFLSGSQAAVAGNQMHPSRRRIVCHLLALDWATDARTSFCQPACSTLPETDHFLPIQNFFRGPLSRLRGKGRAQNNNQVVQSNRGLSFVIAQNIQKPLRSNGREKFFPTLAKSALKRPSRRIREERQTDPPTPPRGHGEKKKYGWRRRHHHWATHTSDIEEGWLPSIRLPGTRLSFSPIL